MLKMIPINLKDPIIRTFMEMTQIAGAMLKYIDTRFYQEIRGLSLIKYMVLQALSIKGGSAKHTELAAWTNTKKHNITALVDRMKEEGLVTTEWSRTDRRVNNVVLTVKGRDIYEEARPVGRKIIRELMKGLTKTDAVDLERLLDMIKVNIERM
jgi:DNA-binding MarR family transcriptional regulator